MRPVNNQPNLFLWCARSGYRRLADRILGAFGFVDALTSLAGFSKGTAALFLGRVRGCRPSKKN